MFSVLDQPSFRQRISKLSLKEYHQLGEFNEHGRRTELVRGIVVEKMSKSPLHSKIASRIYRLILAALPAGYSAWKEEPLTLRDSEPEPDVSVTVGDWDAHDGTHPHTAALVAEVAVSSPDGDRAMAELYAEAGVAEYWIILPQECLVEVHLHPQGSHYREMRTFSRAEEIVSASVPGLRLALGDLFAGLP